MGVIPAIVIGLAAKKSGLLDWLLDSVLVVAIMLVLGGVFMLWCDLISRIVAAPQEIPIGVITACIGAPFFLFMLRRGGKIGG